MVIKILGTGCRACNKLEKNVRTALEELNIDATIEKVENLNDIVDYGIVSTPALVIDEEVVSGGKALPVENIKKLLVERLFDYR